jgi:hypothetical protein
MAVTATFKQQINTAKTVKNSGGDAAITLASLANAAARQSAKLDLGATFATLWRLRVSAELAATPSPGLSIDLYWAPSNSATAGTDNPAGISGTDAAYTGQSSNLSASLRQLIPMGFAIVSAQATATVQVIEAGVWRPPSRYGSIVVVNNSNAAFHSTNTNQYIELTPLEGTQE